MSYETGVYTKGDSTKVANTPADAVAAVFDGYTRAGDVPGEVSEELGEASSDEPTEVAETDLDEPSDAELEALTAPDSDADSSSSYQF